MDRVYVGNLPPDIRIKDIDDFFRPFGKLVYIDVNHRANPVYAYVQFDTARNAFNAIKARHGYDYEGYTLQLRLVENEVRKRRDATPPPPPPPMFGEFGSQNNRGGFNNNSNFGNNSNNRNGASFLNSLSSSSFQASSNSQWSNKNSSNMAQQFFANNRLNMSQQNMMDFPNNSRSNMQQKTMMPYSSGGRSNMQQQYSVPNRSNMQNMNFSNQNYSNTNYLNTSYSNTNYSNTNRSNMAPQQSMNMMGNTNNNNSWNSGNNMSNMVWKSDNNNYGGSNNYNNAGTNQNYNANNDPYSRPGFEDNFTAGLSGSGRKWFNRYIRKGFSPKVARAKALEHRTVPYLRDDPKAKKISDDPTNAALETIGNTIISLLSTNPVDNFNNSNWGGDNFQAGANTDMPGPSSSKGRGTMNQEKPPERNRVSKKQYYKSLAVLKSLRGKRAQSANERISKKYHTQIVKDYEQFEKTTAKPRVASSSTNQKKDSAKEKSFNELSIELCKKKQQLFLATKRLNLNPNKRYGGAFKKRLRILMNECGFLELEAKALAVHPIDKLKEIMALKIEYDSALKKSSLPISSKKGAGDATAKDIAYNKDLKLLKMHENKRLSLLSERLKALIIACLNRIHKHEKEANMPLTETKFLRLLPEFIAKNREKAKAKKIAAETKNTTNAKKEVKTKGNKEQNANKGEQKINENADASVAAEKNQDNEKEHPNAEDNEDIQNNEDVIDITEDDTEEINEEEDITEDVNEEDITEEQQVDNEEEYADAENPENDENEENEQNDEEI